MNMHTIQIPSLRTVIGATLHAFTRRNVVLGVLLLTSYAFAYNVGAQSAHDIDARVANIEHACVPIDTGGGVTQCANVPATMPRDVAEVTCAFRTFEDATVTFEQDDDARFACMSRLGWGTK